jgi:3-oxoacyl-[acyl-carrier protein] reductase
MDFEGEHAGKVAVVLGGSRGIGAAIVERLAMDGARVLFTYAASPDRAEDIVARLRGQSCDVVAVRADSGDAGQVEAAIDHAVQRFGRLDVLVVNAGILRNASIDQYSLEDFDRMVAVNIRGVFAALRHAASLMADGGRIITIGSNIAARIGFPKASIYAMTKAAGPDGQADRDRRFGRLSGPRRSRLYHRRQPDDRRRRFPLKRRPKLHGLVALSRLKDTPQ